MTPRLKPKTGKSANFLTTWIAEILSNRNSDTDTVGHNVMVRKNSGPIKKKKKKFISIYATTSKHVPEVI